VRDNDPFALNHSPFDACAVAVNNMHLLRGMLGRPGAGILQMNGQPTAQNNRETGADGDLPGFRNWQNEQHVAALAELWDVDPIVIPDWAEPTHAMQIFRYVEQGSINFLWVAGTNPAVSLPELSRIRTILGKESLFLVVSDGYLTETTDFADVVLPAALWVRSRAAIPTPIGRSISPSALSLRPVRRGATWTSGWTTPAGWVSPIAAVEHCRLGIHPRRPSTTPGGNAPGAGLVTTQA
jgi:anaerobic selenocysteine-containing dehydrogenase